MSLIGSRIDRHASLQPAETLSLATCRDHTGAPGKVSPPAPDSPGLERSRAVITRDFGAPVIDQPSKLEIHDNHKASDDTRSGGAGRSDSRSVFLSPKQGLSSLDRAERLLKLG
jgi:hypothetical protein